MIPDHFSNGKTSSQFLLFTTNPFAQKLSSSIFAWTFVSSPSASLLTQAKKCQQIKLYIAHSQPWSYYCVANFVGWIGGWALSSYFPALGPPNIVPSIIRSANSFHPYPSLMFLMSWSILMEVLYLLVSVLGYEI